MLFALLIALILLVLGAFYAGSLNKERSRHALNDDLQHTMRLLIDESELAPDAHSDAQKKPCDISVVRTFEDDEKGILHLLKLTHVRTKLLHPDLQFTLGTAPSSPSLAYTTDMFNGLQTFTLLYKNRWRFTLPISHLFEAVITSPPRTHFEAHHRNLSLRTCVLTHDEIMLWVECPQELLEHDALDTLEKRQHFIMRHCSSLLTLLAHLELNSSLQSGLDTLLHIFTQTTQFALTAPAREKLIELLLSSSQEHIHTRMWHTLLETNQPLELLFVLERFPERMLAQISTEQLIELVRRAHVTHTAKLTTTLPHILPRIPMDLLADASIDFDFKFVLLTAWLQHPGMEPHALQHAIRAMILAHPFDRPRIQRHIIATSGIQKGTLTLSHGVPNGNISIVQEKDSD